MKIICLIGVSTVEGPGDETGKGLWALIILKPDQGAPFIPFYAGILGQKNSSNN